MNVPFTYPPQPLKGFMVTGLLTPSNAVYTYPPVLTEILNEVIGYRIGFKVSGGDKYCAMWDTGKPLPVRREAFSEEYSVIVWKRVEALEFLCRIVDVDAVFIVFNALDHVQHWFMDDKDFVEEWYLKMDKVVAELLKLLKPEDLIILSDHGFTRVEKGGYKGDHRAGGIWVTTTGLKPSCLEDAHKQIVGYLKAGMRNA